MSISASNIGLGCVTFGREIDELASHELLDYAYEHGISFFDTAAAYAEGASESIIGSWLASRRPEPGSFTIATKLRPPYEPGRVSQAVNESLARLGVPALDLLYLHKWDETAECIDFATALDQVVRDGCVRTLGVSNYSQNQLEHAAALHDRHNLERFRVVQNNFNFAVSDMDLEYREYCKSQNIAVVTYSPLGAGFLTGKHKNGVEPGSRFDLIPGHQNVYFNKESESKLSRLEAVAKKSGHSQAHLALAWAMHQPGIDTVLIGGRTRTHIDQALAAKNFDDLKIFAELDSESAS